MSWSCQPNSNWPAPQVAEYLDENDLVSEEREGINILRNSSLKRHSHEIFDSPLCIITESRLPAMRHSAEFLQKNFIADSALYNSA
jgi:hypothetical protein